jgi:starch-binding outer membrane protein, SusD/RagB family
MIMHPRYLLIILTILIPISGCQKLTDVNSPDGRLTNGQTFVGEQTATAAVLATYAKAASVTNILNGFVTCFTSVGADDLNYTGEDNLVKEFYENSISIGNIYVKNNFWDVAYYMIYNTNSCLEGLNKSASLNNDLKKQLRGECKFMRALVYFNLVRLFGEVPLILTTNYETNIKMGRTALSDIHKAIETDLIDAEKDLSVNYPALEKIRANRGAAEALLARFYLYRNDWARAYSESSKVIESGQYRLNKVLDSVFLGNSTESIFQIKPILIGYNSFEANAFVAGGTGIPSFSLTSSLVSVFDSADLRLRFWIGTKQVNGVKYYYPFKYKLVYSDADDFRPTEYNMIIRLAEMYLVRAESAIEMHMMPEAISDINVIRSRAGLPGIPETATEQELKDAIVRERRAELFAECGHRWFDLKRTGKSTEVLKYKQGWQVTDTLWPIPLSQILLNSALTQNAGY